MAVTIPTIEEIDALLRKYLASRESAQPGGPFAMKLSKVPDHFIGLSVKQVERWANEGKITITRPAPGADRYINPTELSNLLRSWDAVTGEKIGE